ASCQSTSCLSLQALTLAFLRLTCLPASSDVSFSFVVFRRPPSSPLFPYTTLFRSCRSAHGAARFRPHPGFGAGAPADVLKMFPVRLRGAHLIGGRGGEATAADPCPGAAAAVLSPRCRRGARGRARSPGAGSNGSSRRT